MRERTNSREEQRQERTEKDFILLSPPPLTQQSRFRTVVWCLGSLSCEGSCQDLSYRITGPILTMPNPMVINFGRC